MDIIFKEKNLKKYANDNNLAKRKLGNAMAKKYSRRLDDIAAAETLEDLRNAPGRYHELTGDRKGQWACDLGGQNRLIFTSREDPIPVNEDGKYIWSEIKGVKIIEIKDYH